MIGSYLPTMHTEVVPPHLTKVLCILIVDIFWTAISIKEFSKEAIPLHNGYRLNQNGFFDIALRNYIVRLKKQMQIDLASAKAH